MKTIYKAGNITEAHIVSGMLSAHGIENHVGGHHLQGGVGEMATMDFARVWVEDEDYEAALPIIAEYEQAEPETDSADDANKEPAVMGTFTPPVLMGISLCLLIIWFVF